MNIADISGRPPKSGMDRQVKQRWRLVTVEKIKSISVHIVEIARATAQGSVCR